MQTNEPQRAGQRVQIFSGLSFDEMGRIATHARSMRKARGEFIYTPGDRSDCVYILRQGRVKLSVLSESGKEIAIDIIQPGEIFGEFALVDESPRSNMAQALDDLAMWVFTKRDFTHLLTSQPKLALSYIRPALAIAGEGWKRNCPTSLRKSVSARVCELLHEPDERRRIRPVLRLSRAAYSSRRREFDRRGASNHYHCP